VVSRDTRSAQVDAPSGDVTPLIHVLAKWEASTTEKALDVKSMTIVAFRSTLSYHGSKRR
jgi:hypothetical protein